MEPEVMQFAASIGATEPSESDEIFNLYRALFREHNYFRHSSGFLVIKISRSPRPFWGLTREIMQALNEHFSYHLVLLKSAAQGWVFSKEETVKNIKSRRWNLDGKGLQYKINMPLPESNFFIGQNQCLKKLGAGEA